MESINHKSVAHGQTCKGSYKLYGKVVKYNIILSNYQKT